MFERTKAAVEKGRQVKATVRAAPASAKAAGAEIARKTGSKLLNGRNHCSSSPNRVHQAAVPGSLGPDKPPTVKVDGYLYQVMYCRNCQGITKVMSTGKKN